MSIRAYIPFMGGGNPYEDLVTGLRKVQDDADALALLPYDDGTFFLKPCNFDKQLIGGQGGYETPDGDKIVLDGDGEPKRDLFGVPMLLAVDPTEHAAAVDPIKALVAQKHNIGEYIRVDKKGNLVEIGEALEAVSEDEDGWPELDDNSIDLSNTAVEEKLRQAGLSADQASDQAIATAMKQLAEEGSLRTVYDIAPPTNVRVADPSPDDNPEGQGGETAVADGGTIAEAHTDSRLGFLPGFGNGGEQASAEPIGGDGPDADDGDDGEDWPQIETDEATHIAVDQSKAADLLPTTTSTTELNVALDKARMEEHDEDKWKSIFIQGMVAGGVTAGIMAIVMGGLLAIV